MHTLQVFVLFLVISISYAGDLDKDAIVTRFENVIDPEGTYQFGYETTNGIIANEEGEGGVRAQGFYRYVSPEGQNIEINYIADENGYQPTGDHLPRSPDIPELIQRALDYVLANSPAA